MTHAIMGLLVTKSTRYFCGDIYKHSCVCTIQVSKNGLSSQIVGELETNWKLVCKHDEDICIYNKKTTYV